ncbi:hypothetical protein ACHAW6_004361 [Cyclotella cf. meneghiniana]
MNANAQPCRSPEIEKRMPHPMTLRPFNLPVDPSSKEARTSDTPVEVETSHRDFSMERATMGHMNPLHNTPALSTTGAVNMPVQSSVFSLPCFTQSRSKETPKVKYDYGDRYSFQNVAARKRGDGTIPPISVKRQSNGEYARPIGRQRKSMEWDGVRGLWVPVPCQGNPSKWS